jgi:hypothetical protein
VKSVCQSWFGAVVLSLNSSAAFMTMKAGLVIRSWALSSRIISAFFYAGYLMPLLPHPQSCFFEHVVFQGETGHQFLHVAYFAAKFFHFRYRSRSLRIAIEPAFASFEELL